MNGQVANSEAPKRTARPRRRFLRRFMTRGGGTAMIFGLAFIPLSLLTLTAVDFHRATTVKSALQDAIDAASLAAARSAATSEADIQAIGYRTLRANLREFPDASLTKATFTLAKDGTVTGAAEVAVMPLVANMFLGGPIDVSAEADVVRSNDKLEIVLVLDNTGSMQVGNKIGILRNAARDLVDDLSEAAAGNPSPDALKIGLVPFSMTVRVGSQYRNASWVDGSASSSLHGQVFDGAGNRFAMLQRMKLNWAGCVESRPYPHDVRESPPSAGNGDTLYVPYFAPDEPDIDDNRGNGLWGYLESYEVWNDYLPDGVSKGTKKSPNPDYGDWFKHQGNTGKYGTSGLSTAGGRGPNAGCTMAPIERLTTDFADLKTAISGMVATGETNIPMGLIWGWHLLSPNAPFRDGAVYSDPDVTKVAILMTDGDNTNLGTRTPNDSSYTGLGYVWMERLGLDVGSSNWARTNAMNSRLAELCANMKAQGVVLYTVRVEVKSGSSSLLRNCASTPDNFYDVQNAEDLNEVFARIAGQISRLRIAR